MICTPSAPRSPALLADPALARRLGDAAHRTVRARFLGDRHLAQYAALLESVLG